MFGLFFAFICKVVSFFFSCSVCWGFFCLPSLLPCSVFEVNSRGVCQAVYIVKCFKYAVHLWTTILTLPKALFLV